RTLTGRGHRISFFQIADFEQAVVEAGLDFRRIGDLEYPPGTLRRLDEKLSMLHGSQALRFTIERLRAGAEMLLSSAPTTIREAGVQSLIIDELELAGGSVAEHLALPFINIACAAPLIPDDSVPPVGIGWQYR